MSKRKLIDTLVTSLACFLVLIGLSGKVAMLMNGHWVQAGGAIIFYLLFFVLFVIRRNSQDAVDLPTHYFFAIGGTFLPLLLQNNPDAPEFLVLAFLPLEIVGMAVSIVAVATLGRGFGIIAAKRELKTHGLYGFVRHPLYAGEAIWFFSLVMMNFNWQNLLLFVIQTAFQIRRMKDEESLLLKDPVYATYYEQVRYRMLPGIY